MIIVMEKASPDAIAMITGKLEAKIFKVHLSQDAGKSVKVLAANENRPWVK